MGLTKGKLRIKDSFSGQEPQRTVVFIVESQQDLLDLCHYWYGSSVYPHIARELDSDWVHCLYWAEENTPDRVEAINVVRTSSSYIGCCFDMVNGDIFLGYKNTKEYQRRAKWVLKYPKLDMIKEDLCMYFTTEETLPFLDIAEGISIMNRNKP